MRRWIFAGSAAAALVLTGCSGGSATPAAVTKTVVKTTTVTATVTAEAQETTDDVDPADSIYIPVVSDFTIGVKILSKQCFGSAGCNITLRVEPSYIGHDFDPAKTAEVTYEIIGSEDPYTNTFTMTGDGTASVQREEDISTTTDRKITAKITDVELVDYDE